MPSAGARKLPAYLAAPSSVYLTQTVPRHEEKKSIPCVSYFWNQNLEEEITEIWSP